MIRHLFSPVDAAIFIYLRFFVGVMLSIELMNGLSIGDLAEYTAPFHFTYLYFDWVKPWPTWGMIFHFTLTILAGFSFALGIFQRLSAIILFLGYSTLFLMEKSEYVNHFYLYCLIAFWMIFLPTKKGPYRPAPRWFYWLMLFHISLVYFYAGIAKLDYEWLSLRSMDTVIGPERRWQHFFFTYAGLGFDLLIVPLLCWRRTRTAAFILALGFHLTNVWNFGLATFPWFCLMMTALFFGASWPRRFSWFDDFFPGTDGTIPRLSLRHYLLMTFVGLYAVVQLTLPLRHHLYPGRVSWTEEGHQFSWRMKLRTKTGDAFFYVKDSTTLEMRTIYPQDFLTQKQYDYMIGKPDAVLEFSHYLKRRLGSNEVYASSRVSLNGSPRREMVNLKVNLAQQTRMLGPYQWIRK
jgi:hypothetical protein